LHKRDTGRIDVPKAVLSRHPSEGHSELLRAPAPPALAAHLQHFWSVRWDFRGALPFLAHTLPHPCVHLIFENGEGLVYGLSRRPFRRQLTGKDRVFGAKFRPAAFAPLLDRPMAALTEERIGFAALFGRGAKALERAILATDDFDLNVARLSEFLAPRLKPLPLAVVEMRDLVERVERDPSILRVEQMAAASGLDKRTLQRHFRAYVGLPPKWVIGRYRLHEAAARLKSGGPADLGALAQDLGYFDQAHFIRDFRRHVGESPGRFLKR
jgi:AraC-like DNA-binding protein